MTNWEMRLKVDGLACVRGGRRVFAGVRAVVEPGRAVELKGPNGSGKSTLLRALAGLTPIESGDVRIGDAALSTARDVYQERVAYAGHLDAVKPALSLFENLLFWTEFFGVEKLDAGPAARGALDRFQLGHMADAPAAHCSAGQRRRLGLARLAVVNRAIWLLDEPTASLDAASTAELGQLLREHLAEGGAALIATHAPLPIPTAGAVEMGDFRPDENALSGDVFADPLDDPATASIFVRARVEARRKGGGDAEPF